MLNCSSDQTRFGARVDCQLSYAIMYCLACFGQFYPSFERKTHEFSGLVLLNFNPWLCTL